MEDINKELISFIPTFWLKKGKILNRSIRIEEDLGIYGDDAADFMDDYRRKFNVDISNFNFRKYFSEEFNFLGWIYFKLFPSSKQKIKTLTVGDLEKGIKYGKLDDEIILL